MPNVYQMLRSLIPNPPLLVGEVMAVEAGGCTIQLPDGGTIFARGNATVGQNVFVRGGVIEGVAPTLTVETIEV